MRKLLRWCLTRRKRIVFLLVVVPLVLLNAITYMHARAFTHYARGGTTTSRPEALCRWQKLRVLLTGITLPRPENRSTPAAVGLPFTTHTIGVDGVTLEAWHVPADQSRGLVLLFHGHGGCKATLLQEAVAFHELGYAALLVDFRGSGGSSESVSTLGVQEADDVTATVGYARQHWPGQRLVLFGQSMGAAAILRAVALRGVQPDVVLLECPFDRLLTTVEHRFEAMGVPVFPSARLLLFWGGVQNDFDAFAHNPVEYAARVRCPVLVMHGAHDPRVRTVEVEAIVAALAGAKGFESFEDTGHQSYCGKCRQQWCETTERFLWEHLK